MRVINSFKYAFRGLLAAIREQPNLKIHLGAAMTITTIGIYLNFNYVDWCIVIITAGTVMGAEVINTSIEEIVNLISPEKRPEAGRVKDLAAGAVLIVSFAALMVGIVLIYSKLF